MLLRRRLEPLPRAPLRRRGAAAGPARHRVRPAGLRPLEPGGRRRLRRVRAGRRGALRHAPAAPRGPLGALGGLRLRGRVRAPRAAAAAAPRGAAGARVALGAAGQPGRAAALPRGAVLPALARGARGARRRRRAAAAAAPRRRRRRRGALGAGRRAAALGLAGAARGELHLCGAPAEGDEDEADAAASREELSARELRALEDMPLARRARRGARLTLVAPRTLILPPSRAGAPGERHRGAAPGPPRVPRRVRAVLRRLRLRLRGRPVAGAAVPRVGGQPRGGRERAVAPQRAPARPRRRGRRRARRGAGRDAQRHGLREPAAVAPGDRPRRRRRRSGQTCPVAGEAAAATMPRPSPSAVDQGGGADHVADRRWRGTRYRITPPAAAGSRGARRRRATPRRPPPRRIRGVRGSRRGARRATSARAPPRRRRAARRAAAARRRRRRRRRAGPRARRGTAPADPHHVLGRGRAESRSSRGQRARRRFSSVRTPRPTAPGS